MSHHDAAHTAFFFNPAITEAVGQNAPWVFENNDTSPPADVADGRGPRGSSRPAPRSAVAA